jgi:2-octaprenyl-6-methoxyphenol hydroxylase
MANTISHDTAAIIGTGLTGLVQALALAQENFKVTLIGPVPSVAQDDRTTAILMPGITFLKDLGVWDDLVASSTPLTTMELIDGTHHSVFDAAEIDQMVFGYNISNAVLKKALIARLKKNKHITWHATTATTIAANDRGWDITLTSNKKISCALLIGADGRDGITRHAAQIEIDEKTIDQTALVSILKCSKPHYNTTVEWYRQGGPLTLVPMHDNKFALVWCGTSEDQRNKQSQPLTQSGKELSELTAHRFGELKVIQPFQAWSVRPMKATQLVAKNCALIGEAAHVLPPIGAQGFNTSLQDIIALTSTLLEGRSIGYLINDAIMLSRYESVRIMEVKLRYSTINTINALLLSTRGVMHHVRRAGLFGIQTIPFVKKYIMEAGIKPLNLGRTRA